MMPVPLPPKSLSAATWEPSSLLLSWASVLSMARKAKANPGGLWLITGSCPLCPLLGEVIAITKVGYRSPAESPRAAKQAQVKHLHSTHRTDQMWFSNSLDLQALEKAQVWLLFNSQTNSCGMLQLLVTIPLPVWDFDFIFRHVKLGGWLSLEQLTCGGGGRVGAGQGKFSAAYCVWKRNLEESDAVCRSVCFTRTFQPLWQISCP